MSFKVIDTWGLLKDAVFDNRDSAIKHRRALNRQYKAHGRFWVKPG